MSNNENIIGRGKDGRRIFSLAFKLKIVKEYNNLEKDGNGRKYGVTDLCEKHSISPKQIHNWARAKRNSVGETPKKSATSMYQGGATVKPKRDKHEVIAQQVAKHLKEIQALKAKIVALVEDM